MDVVGAHTGPLPTVDHIRPLWEIVEFRRAFVGASSLPLACRWLAASLCGSTVWLCLTVLPPRFRLGWTRHRHHTRVPRRYDMKVPARRGHAGGRQKLPPGSKVPRPIRLSVPERAPRRCGGQSEAMGGVERRPSAVYPQWTLVSRSVLIGFLAPSAHAVPFSSRRPRALERGSGGVRSSRAWGQSLPIPRVAH